MSLSNQAAFYLDKLTRFYNNLSAPRLLVTTLTQPEISTVEGDKYQFTLDLTLAQNETYYLLVEVPSGSNFSTGFLEREWVAFNGAAELKLYYDFTIDRANESPIVGVFNQRVALRNTKPHQTGLYSIPAGGVASVGPIAYETSLITSSGVGANTSGGVSPAVGFRIYDPSELSLALIAVKNLHNGANRMLLGYTFAEAPLSL